MKHLLPIITILVMLSCTEDAPQHRNPAHVPQPDSIVVGSRPESLDHVDHDAIERLIRQDSMTRAHHARVNKALTRALLTELEIKHKRAPLSAESQRELHRAMNVHRARTDSLLVIKQIELIHKLESK